MVETGMMADAPPASGVHEDVAVTRRLSRRRGLPGGRAVVGALLVTIAAVTTFGAYLSASAAPTTAYVVATEQIAPGTRLGDESDIRRRFGSVHVELVPPLDERAIAVAELDDLAGQVLLAPLERGDLVTRTMLGDDDGGGRYTMSLALAPDDAVAGALRPGEYIDVLATFGSGDGARTSYVVRGVPLLRTSGTESDLVGGSRDFLLTVAVDEPRDVQALGHASNTGQVFVTRSAEIVDGGQRLPEPFGPETESGEVGSYRPGAAHLGEDGA